MTDLVARLRKLAKAEHDDLSIGDEAADRIEQLERDLAAALALLKEAREWVDQSTFHDDDNIGGACYICMRVARIDALLGIKG